MLRRIVACRCGSVNPSVRGGLSVRLICEQLLRLRGSRGWFDGNGESAWPIGASPGAE